MTFEIGWVLLQTVIIIVLWVLWRVTKQELKDSEDMRRNMSHNYDSWMRESGRLHSTWNSRRDRIEKAAAKAIAILQQAVNRNEDKP